MTEPTRTRRHAAPPGRALALLLLVTASIVGLLAAGLWMIAFAPEPWQRVIGQVIAFLATVQMVAVPRSCGERGGHNARPSQSGLAELRERPWS